MGFGDFVRDSRSAARPCRCLCCRKAVWFRKAGCLDTRRQHFLRRGAGSSSQRESSNQKGRANFAYYVRNPSDYGVVEFDGEGRPVGIEEKPEKPRSPYAITGLYFYDESVYDIALHLTPSKRGEIEITGINKAYLDRQQLDVQVFGLVLRGLIPVLMTRCWTQAISWQALRSGKA